MDQIQTHFEMISSRKSMKLSLISLEILRWTPLFFLVTLVFDYSSMSRFQIIFYCLNCLFMHAIFILITGSQKQFFTSAIKKITRYSNTICLIDYDSKLHEFTLEQILDVIPPSNPKQYIMTTILTSEGVFYFHKPVIGEDKLLFDKLIEMKKELSFHQESSFSIEKNGALQGGTLLLFLGVIAVIAYIVKLCMALFADIGLQLLSWSIPAVALYIIIRMMMNLNQKLLRINWDGNKLKTQNYFGIRKICTFSEAKPQFSFNLSGTTILPFYLCIRFQNGQRLYLNRKEWQHFYSYLKVSNCPKTLEEHTQKSDLSWLQKLLKGKP